MPGIYQEYIPKGREWRVTVVGEKVFSTAIYTAEEARDDWRRLQMTEKVQFRTSEEQIPAPLQARCKQMLNELNLRYGAFDFIETPDGRIVFLEVNPNGQYGWVDKSGAIARALGDELIRIAES